MANPIELAVQEDVYSLDVVQRAAHAMSDRFLTMVERRDGALIVRLVPLHEQSALDIEFLFHTRLVDEALRVRVAEETKDFRTSVLQLAFGSALRQPS